jgi:hypothetical protein
VPGWHQHLEEIDDGAVRPMTGRHADDGGAVGDGAEDGFRPASLRVPLDSNDLRIVLSSGFAPGEDVRGEVLREKDDGVARIDFEIGGGDRHAVADSRNERDGVRASAQDVAGDGAELLGGGEPVCAGEGPGRGLDAHGVEPRGGDGLQLRRHVGAVQVSNAGWEFEQMCGVDRFHTIHAGMRAA